MRVALKLARHAASIGEIPIGAVIEHEGKIIGTGFNLKESCQQASDHAEMIAIREASHHLGAWRLLNSTLYTTLEPCLMCAGGILQSRIPRVIYGASDPKGGAMGSLYNLHADIRLNHSVTVKSGLYEEESRLLLKAFFKSRRKR